jgi:hypothetical protein
MQVRAEAVANAASLVSRARPLEESRRLLIEKLNSTRQRIEQQKIEGGLIASLLSRPTLPSLKEAQEKSSNIRNAIEREKQEQISVKNKIQQLQSSLENSITLSQKRGEYDRVANDSRSLSVALEEERQRESVLKFQQSHLSAELLTVQLNKKRMEKRLAEEVEAPIDFQGLQRRKKSLIDQRSLVQTKREAFEQTLTETIDGLEGLRIRQEELKEIAERTESVNIEELKQKVLDGAAENLDLRSYEVLPREAERLLEELTRLAEASASLVFRTRMELA